MLGTITKVFTNRDFGFVETEDGQQIFFHRNQLRGLEFNELLRERIVFVEIERSPRGPRARRVSSAT